MIMSILLSVTSCVSWTALGIAVTVGLCVLGRKVMCDYYGLKFVPETVTLVFSVLAILLSFNYIMIAKNNMAIQAAETTTGIADVAMAVGGDYMNDEVREKVEYVKTTAETEAEKARKEARTMIWIFSILSVVEVIIAVALARSACRSNVPRRRSVGARSRSYNRRRR